MKMGRILSVATAILILTGVPVGYAALAGANPAAGRESSADVKRRHADAQKEIKATQQRIRDNEAEVKRNLEELGRIESDIADSKEAVAEADRKVNDLKQKISGLQRQIADDEDKLGTLRAEYLKAVKKMRVKRKEQSVLAFIFSSENFNQAVRRMRYLKEVSKWRERQTSEINRHVAYLQGQTLELGQTKKMHDGALARQVQAQNNLQAQYAKQDQVVADLKRNGDELREYLSNKQQEVNALRNRVSALIAEEQRKAEEAKAARLKAEAEKKAKAEAEAKARAKVEAERKAQAEAQARAEAKAKAEADRKAKIEAEAKAKAQAGLQAKEEAKQKQTPVQPTVPKKPTDPTFAEARNRQPRNQNQQPSQSSNNTPASQPDRSQTPSQTQPSFESMKGSLPRPVAGAFKVTSRFGRNAMPKMPDIFFDNPGIDAEVSAGAAVLAVYGGKVAGVYGVPGYSKVVIVNHDGYYTVYGNIASATVEAGDSVKQGQTLGKLAIDKENPGHSTIHFEVWKNRDKQNPLSWIK